MSCVEGNGLNVQLSTIDDLALKSNQMIELAKERRTALISAAVTGKIDVRHLVETEAA